MVSKIRLIFDPAVTLHELTKAYTLLAMDHFDGNKIQASEALGITLKTLYNRLDAYGIDYPYNSWEKGLACRSIVHPDYAIAPVTMPIDGLPPGVA